ncbi:hypothetical protein NDU88_000238 [Pleurodeles waltl]|uniref:Uncharacterized protein n=1 Tax=Pleurodeles waltl TaxID=8319 RepID=A0AAV7VSW8_PLEWA|nr:hypothetical protein NDU88_000238 [Pleurodeles waltl]
MPQQKLGTEIVELPLSPMKGWVDPTWPLVEQFRSIKAHLDRPRELLGQGNMGKIAKRKGPSGNARLMNKRVDLSTDTGEITEGPT